MKHLSKFSTTQRDMYDDTNTPTQPQPTSNNIKDNRQEHDVQNELLDIAEIRT